MKPLTLLHRGAALYDLSVSCTLLNTDNNGLEKYIFNSRNNSQSIILMPYDVGLRALQRLNFMLPLSLAGDENHFWRLCVRAYTNMTVYITLGNYQIDTQWSNKRMRWKAKVPMWMAPVSLPPLCDDDDITTPHPLIAFSDQWGREKERNRERERGLCIFSHTLTAVQLPHVLISWETQREQVWHSSLFCIISSADACETYVLQDFQLCFPSFCCCGFYTVLVVAFLPCLWNERVSCLRRFHVSMGTAVSKRKNLRNDAISSVAAKVRWVTPGALRIWTRYMEASVRLGRYLSFQVPPNRSYPCVTVQFPLRFPGTASPSL